jgi:predicted NAD-dependent protein-ADP-ribosyltransferase YbiA (DUF1768 family)
MNNKNLLSEKVMNFFFRKEEGKCLSNFWECLVKIEDDCEVREYDSGESCFHGEKFIRIGKLCEDENRKKDLLEYGRRFLKGVCEKNGGVIKRMGRKFILSPDELRLWYKLSVDVQIEICKYKFENYNEVKDMIDLSMGRILVHPAMRCSEEKVKNRLWEGKGIVVDGKVEVIGMNMLGKLWMNLREENC